MTFKNYWHEQGEEHCAFATGCYHKTLVMKQNTLKQYVTLRKSLTAEKARLEARLQSINEALGTGATTPTTGKRGGKRHMSASARARISAAQTARWAKINAAKKRANA